MAQSGSGKVPDDRESNSKSPRTLDDHFNALFNAVVGLPSAIYSRGNEHGREWNRRYCGEQHEDAEPVKQRHESRTCARENGNSESTYSSPEACQEEDDWVSGIIEELVRGEEKAKEMYEWWARLDGRDERRVEEYDRNPQNSGMDNNNSGVEEVRKELATSSWRKEDKEWSQIFPAWREGAAANERTTDASRRNPARDVDDTIDKLHHDLERWFGDAEKWTRQVQRGFERDSRLWEDEGLFGPSIPFSKPLSTLFSLGMRPFLPQESAVNYLLYSEYSPLHLEHEDGFDGSWRLRFEDLLRTQDGKKMLPADDADKKQTSSGVDWLSQIMPLLKDAESSKRGRITIGSTSSDQPVVQVEDLPSPTQPSLQAEEAGLGPVTDMDLYERHFSQMQHSTPGQPATKSPVANEFQTPPNEPSVLSTLTKTERHVASDGSVTTKTVLKKRFADGREESSETLETTPSRPYRTRESDQTKEEGRPADYSKKRGWFWSS